MTQMVTIEGSVTPSAELPRGEQRTVVYTDRIAGLVKRGFVVIVKGPTDVDSPVETELTPIPEANQLPPADGQPHTVEGTGEPNVGHDMGTADGSWHELAPHHPDEYAQPTPPPLSHFQADAPTTVVDNPKAPATSESDTGG